MGWSAYRQSHVRYVTFSLAAHASRCVNLKEDEALLLALAICGVNLRGKNDRTCGTSAVLWADEQRLAVAGVSPSPHRAQSLQRTHRTIAGALERHVQR